MSKKSTQKNIIPSLVREIIVDLGIRHWFLTLLVLTVVLSAMMQARTAHDTRLAIAESQKLREERQQEEINWQALRLELTSLTEANRIASKAQKELKMNKVDSKNEKIITL